MGDFAASGSHRRANWGRCFIGHQRKYGALSALNLLSRSARARKPHGEIHLDKAHRRDKQQMPIADGDLSTHDQLPRTKGLYACHEVNFTQFAEPPLLAALVSDDLYHRALLPWMDVVCIFAEDIGGTDIAIQHLSAWNFKGPSSKVAGSPAVILVVDREDETKVRAKLNAEKLQRPHGWFRVTRGVGIDREAHESSSSRRQTKSYQALQYHQTRAKTTMSPPRPQEQSYFSV